MHPSARHGIDTQVFRVLCHKWTQSPTLGLHEHTPWSFWRDTVMSLDTSQAWEVAKWGLFAWRIDRPLTLQVGVSPYKFQGPLRLSIRVGRGWGKMGGRPWTASFHLSQNFTNTMGRFASLILKVHYKIGNFWLYIVIDSINTEIRKYHAFKMVIG